MKRALFLAAVMLCAIEEVGRSSQSTGVARLPVRLETVLASSVRPTAADRKLLLGGAPLTKLLEADPAREVAVFGAIWINAGPQAYVEAVKDIERFERGGPFTITKRISDPPQLEDFAQVTLTDEDFADLQDCRVGDCELKLDARSIEAIRAGIDFTKPTARQTVEAAARRRAYDFVRGYRERGNAGLAVYRDSSRPTFVAAEFASIIDRLPGLTEHLPNLRRYLLEYPNAALPRSTDFLYWQETDFGLKPTIRISHLVIQENPSETVVASKMLYASHYFWTALELRVLLPDPARGPGFWLVTVNRSRSDGLSGFVGRIVRGRVRTEVQKGILAAMTATKARLEAK
jgi:hypothetical protein